MSIRVYKSRKYKSGNTDRGIRFEKYKSENTNWEFPIRNTNRKIQVGKYKSANTNLTNINRKI